MKRGPLFCEKWYTERAKALEFGAEPPLIKLVAYQPLPRWDCASFYRNNVEFTIIKGESILTVENSYELIFFLSKQHCGKARGRCYLGIPGILGLSPDSSLTGFLSFSNMATRKQRDGGERVEKETGVPFSEQKSTVKFRKYAPPCISPSKCKPPKPVTRKTLR